MIVCSCFAITEEDLRQALRNKLPGIPVDCPAGEGCGTCREMVERLRREESDPSRAQKHASGDARTRGIEV